MKRKRGIGGSGGVIEVEDRVKLGKRKGTGKNKGRRGERMGQGI